MRKRCLLASLVAVLVAGGVGSAVAASDADRCGGSKTKGAAKYARGVFTCHASALRRGEAVDPVCTARASGKLVLDFDRSELRGGCVTADDDAAVQAVVDDTRSAVDALLTPDPNDPARQCAAAKLLGTGRFLATRLGCYGKSGARGAGPGIPCLTMAGDRLASAFSRAEGRGGCTTTGDPDTFRGMEEVVTTDLVRALSPVCGDAIQGPTQDCEVGDDAACPGLCNQSCTCDPPPVCGDGVARLPEECDDSNLMDGDGCSASCELEDASAVCAGVASSSGTSVDAVFVSNNFNSPLFVTAPRLDARRLFVVERQGYVRILDLATNTVKLTPFLDMSDLTSTSGERGFFSMAFDPAYESNGRFFVSYTNTSGDLVLARYEVDAGDPDAADESTRKELLVVPHPGSQNHNGGQIQFGGDGYLYWSMGDGGQGTNAQDPMAMLGKLLRLDVNHASAPFATVPSTNPGYVDGTSPLEYVWAKGLRNPFRFSFDRQSGDLYIGDVGANSVEEISFAPAASPGGQNYGWNIFEGSSCRVEPCPDPPTGFTMPVHEYAHGGRHCAVIGGYSYRGCAMPDLSGNYFFSDLCSAFVRTFKVVGGAATSFTDRSKDAKSTGVFISGVVSWGEDARGEIYLISGGGSIYRIQPE